MKKILRSAVVAAGLVTATVAGMTSANAVTAATFTGEANIASFGTGASSGTATLCVNGVVHNETATACTPTAQTNAVATFSVNENSSECPATGTASGTVTVQTTTGSETGAFTWTRVGANAVITVTWSDGTTATGTATFAVTSHVGNPCGARNVKASVAGTITGDV